MVTYGLTKDFVFQNAVDFLESKEAVDAEVYRRLEKKERDRAFTVSGYTSGEILNTFLKELADAVEEGATMETFRERMNTFLADNGYEAVNPFHADVIFRTNVQTAYMAGHYESMQEAKTFRPYWQYKTAGDGKVRDSHLAMADRVYAADDPIWNIWYPPNGFRCRCTVVSLTKSQLIKRGLTVQKAPPRDIKTGKQMAMPDKGFSNNPAMTPWHPDLSDFDETLRGLIKEKQAKGREI